MNSKEIMVTGNGMDHVLPATTSPLQYSRNTSDHGKSPAWPNEWRAVYNESESSDWLSQSIASSTSWSDELEGDLTKSLQDQLRVVENTLYRDGSPQLSARNHLKDECRLWQKNFPHLRVLGEAIKPSVGCQTRSRLDEVEEQIDEIIAAHGVYDEDSSIKAVETKKCHVPETNEVYKEKIKKAVIEQIFARIWPEVVKKIEPMLRKNDDSQGKVVSSKSESSAKCDDSFDEELTSGFNSLTIVEDQSVNSYRTKSGRRSAVSARRTVCTMVPIKPIVLECSIPIPSSVRTSSAMRRSPNRLSQPPMPVKYPSPDRLLSPLVYQSELRPVGAVKSAGARKTRTNCEKKSEVRYRPQYDAKTGRMISRDESKSGLRRNLKTSPPVPMYRHGALPPIDTMEIVPKTLEISSKRSASAFFKGGRLNSGSRPNTSLTAKNQVLLSPVDSLQIRQSAVPVSRYWQPEQHTYANCEILQLKPSDQRQRWRNRSNVLRK